MLLYAMVMGSLFLAAFCLLLWTSRRTTGHDAEAAKYRMLELERETGVNRR